MKIIFAVLTLFLFSGCQNSTGKITGVWQSRTNPEIIIEFSKDKYFCEYESGVNKNTEIVQLEELADGTLKEFNYGKLKFEIIEGKCDSIFVKFYGENNDRLYTKRTYLTKKNILTEIIYKEGKGIDSHIQTVNSYVRKGGDIDSSFKTDKWIFKLPENFDKEIIYVAFNQENGIPAVGLDGGKFAVIVPSSGLVKTTLANDVHVLTEGNVEFTQQTNEGSDEPVRVIQAREFARLKYLLNTQSSQVKMPCNLDSLVIFSTSRYNPSRDRVVNKVFSETIEGNVIAFRRNTLRKELTFLGYDLSEYE